MPKSAKNSGRPKAIEMDTKKAITVLMGMERSIGDADSQEAIALNMAIEALEEEMR